jgi:hypothetical protein
MRRAKTNFVPGIATMEPRLLLSTAAPLVSRQELTGVVREIKAIVSSLARTHDTVQASTQLTGLSSQLPSGSERLAAAWQNDLSLYRPHSAKSAISTEQRIINALERLVAEGTQSVSGSGSTTSAAPVQGSQGAGTPISTPTPTPSPAPTPAPSLDSVRIQNTTGLALVVTVYLNDSQNPEPFITETIPAQGDPTVLFNFGTSTNAFMTMNISRADGLQSPAPFDNINLSQPLDGYDGTLFSISLLGPYFNVNFS